MSNFIPGKMNPVDIATGGDIEHDEAMKCWSDGPDFLLKYKADWSMTDAQMLERVGGGTLLDIAGLVDACC